MNKFSKIINESHDLDKNDIDKVIDILSDFKDDSNFEITFMKKASGQPGLPYYDHIPEYVNTFKYFEIIIFYKKNSNEVDFFKEVSFFNENIQNVISHLESIGKVFHKTKIEYDREYINETDKNDKFTYKKCRVDLHSTIKVFPN
jgi:hypothetical protein